MDSSDHIKLGSASQFITSLFDQDLTDDRVFDPDVVAIIRKHLVTVSPHSRAGARLAQELVQLARKRASEVHP
jgi:hypothetical protein